MKGFLFTAALLSFQCLASVDIRVTDFWGRPIAGVAVMAGTKVNAPFPSNIALTNGSGAVSFSTGSLQSIPVTLVAPGHPKITYFNQSGEALKLRLPPPIPQAKQDVKGKFDRWGKIPSGNAQFGLFFPFMSSSKIFSFNVADIISTSTDTLTVMGQTVNIPSNFVIPKQTINYGIFSVQVDKPVFRMPVGIPNTYTFAGVSGDFPVKTVVDKLRGGSTFFDVINDLNLKQFGVLKDLSVSSGTSGLTVMQDQGTLAPCLTMASSQSPSGLEVISVGLVRDEGNLDQSYQVTDLKRVGTSAASLRCVQNDSRPVHALNIGVSYHKEGKAIAFDSKMSSIFVRNVPRAKAGGRIDAANYYAVPQVDVGAGGNSVTFTRSDVTRGAPAAAAIYGVLADVTRTDMGQFIAEDITARWVVFAPQSVTQLDLPELPPEMAFYNEPWVTAPRIKTATVKRWDMVWLGIDPQFHYDSSRVVSVDLGYDLFETMTHAARNAKDF